MSAYTRKLLIAATVSLAGIGASLGWYKLTETDRSDTTAKELAHLEQGHNDVQKRPVKRVIWHSIAEGEALHSGEAVRTAPDADAKIVFNSGAEVDLDPDSVIVIEENGDKVNLDFVKGNLFVKGGGTSNDLALKSGNTSIDVNNAQMSLNKTAGDKKIDIQVLAGSANLKSGGKNVTLDKEHRGTISDDGVDVKQRFFKGLTPGPNDRAYFRMDKNESIHFKWDAVPADYNVKFEAGAKREALKQVGDVVPGNKGDIAVNLKPGVQFWRLVATNKKNPQEIHVSSVSKATVVAEVPPKLLSPAKDQVISATSAKAQEVELRWANPSKLAGLMLEVSKDPKFKEVTPEDVNDLSARVMSLAPGDYYWRVSAKRPGTSTSLSSDIYKFSIAKPVDASPELKTPLADAHVPFETITGGSAFFSWAPVSGITQYKLRVYVDDGKNGAANYIIDKEISEMTQVKIPSMKPGKYKWYVTSLKSDGDETKPNAVRRFTVEDVPPLAWLDNQAQENYQYVTEKASLRAVWKPVNKPNLKSYRVTAKSDDGTEKTVETSNQPPVIDVNKDGLYHVTVEAMDQTGLVIARSSVRDFFVEPKPLLPAPNFEARMPASVKASNSGSATFYWQPVSGAKGYTLQIKDGSGKVVKKEKYGASVGTVKSLLPGSYKVSLSSVDEWGRNGPAGDERGLDVPNTSDAKPPGFKKLQIK